MKRKIVAAKEAYASEIVQQGVSTCDSSIRVMADLATMAQGQNLSSEQQFMFNTMYEIMKNLIGNVAAGGTVGSTVTPQLIPTSRVAQPTPNAGVPMQHN